jgi:Transposase DDE domain
VAPGQARRQRAGCRRRDGQRRGLRPARQPPRGSADPQIRFGSLVENGTHVLFGSHMAGCETGEIPLAREVLTGLQPDMLCLADRQFFGFALWQQACATGAALPWWIKKNIRLPCAKRLLSLSKGRRLLSDGNLPQRQRPATPHERCAGARYRVSARGIPGAEPLYRLDTTIRDPDQAPARELATLDHQRWEIETALDELKTHLRGARIVLRRKTPDLVRQEFYGLILAHFAIRSLMHEAACTLMRIQTGSRFLMPSASCAAHSPRLALFPRSRERRSMTR